MTALITLTLALAPIACPELVEGPPITATLTGWASQYAPGVMARVIATRQAGLTARDLPLDLPPVDGYVAARYPDDIGRVVLLRPIGRREWERFLVVDCAGRNDRRESDGLSGLAWMERYNVLVEVDYETAVRWDTVGRGIMVQMRWAD